VRAGPAGRLHAALKAHELLLRGLRVEPARAASEARDGQAPPAVLKAAA
jgi:hypothetical protein